MAIPVVAGTLIADSNKKRYKSQQFPMLLDLRASAWRRMHK
jgi:hypothetical protein